MKKYFYVLRPLLAIRYVEAHDHPPPIEFQSLVNAVAPDELKPVIARLLEMKKHTPELGLGPPIPEINRFICAEIERHGEHFKGQGRPDIQDSEHVRKELNTLFRAAVRP